MAKKIILIVEDEESLRNILSDKLKEEDFDVETAQDGKRGLDKALKIHPDLMLIDVMMPIMDGVEMVKHLQKDSWGKDAKMMLLTNMSDPIKMAEITSELDGNLTVFDYMVKSDWDLDSVVKRIREKLEN
jgi:DNA-binding response OmpR family regulator